jgi:methylmalonyl-CoA mutase C-terminal domain/subunit
MEAEGVWGDILLVGGGVIPDEDVDALKAMGVSALMGQDTTPDEVVTLIRDLVRPRGATV